MSGPKGMYVTINDYYPDGDPSTHSIRAGVVRTYAKRSLGLVDGPKTAEIARASLKDGLVRKGVWLPVPRVSTCKVNNTSYGSYNACYGHTIPPDVVRKFCIDELGMAEKEPEVRIVEVERIVTVESPLGMSFEERDIIATALRREQHAVNAQLRHAYESGDEQQAELYAGRLTGITGLMGRLGIKPDDWANGPAWVVPAVFGEPAPIDPQMSMFEGEPHAV